MKLRATAWVVGLTLCLLSMGAKAQDTGIAETFARHAAESAGFAIGAAYATGDAAPVILTAGPTEKNGSVAVAGDARWHIGSISKSFTSTLVMQLVDEGRLELDVPVGRYLQDYRDTMHQDWTSPTLRNLLSHTSGLPVNAPPELMRATYMAEPYEGRRTALAAMWDAPSGGEPGAFEYSNIGYVLAGLVIEEVTGSAWEDLIRSRIAAPLGLSSLGFGAPREANAPRGHRSFLGFRRPVDPDDPASDNPRWLGPAGTIHLGLGDLVRWGQFHVQACKGLWPEVLSQARCREMQTPVAGDFALGWVIQSNPEGARTVVHNGSNTMWYALLYIVLDEDKIVAVATNVHQPDRANALAFEVLTALEGEASR